MTIYKFISVHLAWECGVSSGHCFFESNGKMLGQVLVMLVAVVNVGWPLLQIELNICYLFQFG